MDPNNNRSLSLARSLPGWQVTRRIKRAGLTLYEIAKRAKASPSLVSHVIHRRNLRASDKSERIWEEIDRVLGGPGGTAA